MALRAFVHLLNGTRRCSSASLGNRPNPADLLFSHILVIFRLVLRGLPRLSVVHLTRGEVMNRLPVRFWWSILPAFSLFLLTALPAAAQEGALSGTVTDVQSGVGLSAVQVEVKAADGEVVAGEFSKLGGDAAKDRPLQLNPH